MDWLDWIIDAAALIAIWVIAYIILVFSHAFGG